MHITYTGKQEFFLPAQQLSIDTKIAKLGKLLDGNGGSDKQAHIILEHRKNGYRAEITLNYLDHALVGEHEDGEQFTAINLALDKMEKQILKVRDKRRDPHKGSRNAWDKGAAANSVTAAEPTSPDGIPAATNGGSRPRVYRVEPEDGKPMTLDEALLMIDDAPYAVYRDVASDRPAVLIRRPDGGFDLVSC